MKKSIKKLESKTVKNIQVVKGGEGGKGNNDNWDYGQNQTMQHELL
jgi:hypothetical protein